VNPEGPDVRRPEPENTMSDFKTCRCGRRFRPLEDANRYHCVRCTQADLTIGYLAYAKTYEPRPEFAGRDEYDQDPPKRDDRV